MPHLGTTIRWEHGWGFVQDDQTLISYFVHSHSLESGYSLTPGDKVLFEVERTKSRRTQAVRVRKLNEAPDIR